MADMQRIEGSSHYSYFQEVYLLLLSDELNPAATPAIGMGAAASVI
jgi:hypothetical protein